MWGDELKVGRARVVRVIESPATPDTVAIQFPDGSSIRMTAYAGRAIDTFESEGDAAEYANDTTAVALYRGLVRLLYDIATKKLIDVDITI